ncbi:MAG TPA: acyl-CoA dehydrogenase family protein [Acidimicrobiales bacterium]|jgi:alkylation response protein AidB-like acyl-CoA dehydrogenase|nr:acyl-CoA dehydrogenase family protein [Acidimicrobiales bacterium]
MPEGSGIDLELSEAERRLRDQARAWLSANVPRPPLASMDTAEGFEQHRDWEAKLHAAGWSVVSWPTAYGGRGASLTEWLVFEEEYWAAGAPGRVNQNGIYLLGPTIMEVGTEEQKQRFLPAMASGREIWCQGWSEPDAGSDLAAIRSTARPDGSDWVLNGQKTWCSRGAFADWMFGLFRSDPGAERHRGLSFILVPLDAEGVSVRPIAQLDGETGFAEVFLDEVRVPGENLLGQAHRGWEVAMATAAFERGLSLRPPGRFSAAARRLVELARSRGLGPDTPAADRVAQAWMDSEAYRLHTLWTATRMAQGARVGPEASLNKVFWSEMDLAIHEAALELLGEEGQLLRGEGSWLEGFLFAQAGPIYAGTNEIQRNVVAERVLGLPR